MATAEDPTESSALSRLTSFLRDRTVSALRREVHEGSDSSATALVATIEPTAEQLSPLTGDQAAGLTRNAAMAAHFIKDFSGREVDERWTLEDLDASFKGWLEADDKRGCSASAVVAILGSAFGQYCIDNLSMEWMVVTDSHGETVAVRSRACDVRGYPFETVSKRLSAGEHGFFVGVFLVLKNSIASATYAPRDA